MRLDCPGGPHLAYCTNIHPGESWSEVRSQVLRCVVAVKAQIAPRRPFGVGLRLSARAAEELERPAALADLQQLLATHGLYVFTINGFPYGAFHDRRVKEEVYLPDWLEESRLVYTNRLARLLCALLPEGTQGSISTVPGAFRDRLGPGAEERMAERLVRHVATLARLRDQTGRTVVLALEPEPYCHLETAVDAIVFFEQQLFSAKAALRLERITGMPRAASEQCLRRHLGVCFDACHMALWDDDPEPALLALGRAGIQIAKIQISAGLDVTLDGHAPERLAELRAFDDGVYLHQVVERRGQATLRHLDLADALASAAPTHSPRRLRIHFHVPLFQEQLGSFHSTQSYVRRLLDAIRCRPVSGHLEVETYSWHVVPPELRAGDVVESITREMTWVLSTLEQ